MLLRQLLAPSMPFTRSSSASSPLSNAFLATFRITNALASNCSSPLEIEQCPVALPLSSYPIVRRLVEHINANVERFLGSGEELGGFNDITCCTVTESKICLSEQKTEVGIEAHQALIQWVLC